MTNEEMIAHYTEALAKEMTTLGWTLTGTQRRGAPEPGTLLLFAHSDGKEGLVVITDDGRLSGHSDHLEFGVVMDAGRKIAFSHPQDQGPNPATFSA